jgi:putative redox protein
MPVTVNTLNAENFRHSVNINNHELFTDLPKSLGGDDSAPSPHDYFDAALASCKALTVKLYAQKKDIPLTGVTVEVTHDSAEEQKGNTSSASNSPSRAYSPTSNAMNCTAWRIAARCTS